jgi:hypothetical protein
MQVVVHLRTVGPSDAYCGNRITDDGREGKRVCGCGSVGRGREKLKSWEREFVGLWVCGEREVFKAEMLRTEMLK